MSLLCPSVCAGAQLGRLEVESFYSCVWSPCQLMARPLMSVRINVHGVLVAVLGSPTIWWLSLTEAGGTAASQLLKAGLETNIFSHSLFCGSRSLPALPKYWGKAMEGVSVSQEASFPWAISAFGPICKNPVCHTQPPCSLWQPRKDVVHVVSLQIKRSLCGLYH